jgi:hypothetical protein
MAFPTHPTYWVDPGQSDVDRNGRGDACESISAAMAA